MDSYLKPDINIIETNIGNHKFQYANESLICNWIFTFWLCAIYIFNHLSFVVICKIYFQLRKMLLDEITFVQ
jgi:hypothetical protein